MHLYVIKNGCEQKQKRKEYICSSLCWCLCCISLTTLNKSGPAEKGPRSISEFMYSLMSRLIDPSISQSIDLFVNAATDYVITLCLLL